MSGLIDSVVYLAVVVAVYFVAVPMVGGALYVWARSIVRGVLSAMRDDEREQEGGFYVDGT